MRRWLLLFLLLTAWLRPAAPLHARPPAGPPAGPPVQGYGEPPPPEWRLGEAAWLEVYLEPGTPLPFPAHALLAVVAVEAREVEARIPVDDPHRGQLVIQRGPGPSRGPWGPCPARALALPAAEPPLVRIFVEQDTSREQVLAAMAHELAHLLARQRLGEGGGLLLNEGLATWAGAPGWLAWHGWHSLEDAVRGFRREGHYVPLERGERALRTPAPSVQTCLETRDVVYTEWAGFVDWLLARQGWPGLTRLWRGESFREAQGAPLEELEALWLEELERPEGELLARWGGLAGRHGALSGQVGAGAEEEPPRWRALAGHLLDRAAGELESARQAVEAGAFDRALIHLDAAQAQLDSAERALELSQSAAAARSTLLRVLAAAGGTLALLAALSLFLAVRRRETPGG